MHDVRHASTSCTGPYGYSCNNPPWQSLILRGLFVLNCTWLTPPSRQKWPAHYYFEKEISIFVNKCFTWESHQCPSFLLSSYQIHSFLECLSLLLWCQNFHQWAEKQSIENGIQLWKQNKTNKKNNNNNKQTNKQKRKTNWDWWIICQREKF